MSQDMTTTTQRCTSCSQRKPLTEFYPVSSSDPHGPRRSKCKDCNRAYAISYRINGPSLARKVQNELVEHGANNPDALSPEVRDEVFTTKPVDEALLAAYRKRQKAKEARDRRRERARLKSGKLPPMRWGRWEAFA